MTDHVSISRLNDAVDGLLSSAELSEIEAHVDVCAACRNDFAELSETVRTLAALPREATTPGGLWDGIEARIGAGARRDQEEDVPVYRLPTAARSTRRVSFSVPQLTAAGIAVALLSAGLMWVAVGGGGSDPTGSPAVAATTPGGAAARAVSLEGGGYGEAVVRLERILEEGRSVLTAETLVSIEESLATIDAAIDEIDQALTEDPGSDLLLRMLASHRQTRLGVLERAAAAVSAQT